MRIKIGIACLGWLLALSTSMLGQAPTATLVGQVTDTTKANIPDATIVVRNTATNETRATKTTSDGLYTVSNLAPGVYEVTISMVGLINSRRGISSCPPIRQRDWTLLFRLERRPKP